MITDPLAGLRPYHLPEPVSWWPPAPGWWLLAVLLSVLAAAVYGWRRHRRAGRRSARLAARELARLRRALEADGDALACMRGLSRLTRRFVLARFPADHAAGLCGEAWLAYLADKSGEPAFLTGPGRRLADAPYRAMPCDEVADLMPLVERLITGQGGARGRRSR